MTNLLSFSVTASEAERVVYFASIGRTLDPRGMGDTVMVVVISTVYFIEFLAVLFMLWNRNYPPIKAKNPLLMAFVFIASIFWFTGNLQVNGHVPLKDTPLTQCKGIGVWLHILAGVCAVSLLIGFRSFGLYQVFCRNRPYRGPALYIAAIVTIACMLVFGIITESLPDNESVIYNDATDNCGFGLGYRIAMFALIWVSWIVVAILNWRIRKIKSSFNESREITIACIVVFGVLTFMTVLSLVAPRYPASMKLRVVATSLNHFAATSIWWVMMGVPVYKCLTNRQQYLQQWICKLRQDGLQRAYHMETGTSKGNNMSSVDHHHHHHSKHVAMANKEIEYANDNGEFYYGAADNNTSIDIASLQGCPNTTDSSVCSRSGDGAANPSSSVSSLVKHQQSSASNCSSANQMAYSSECPSEISKAYRVQSPPTSKRPWDKLASAVSRLSGPAPSTGLTSPTRLSPPAQPYTHTSEYAESIATPQLQRDAAQGTQLDDNMYGPDDRQIL
ncbi:hypothetical protein IWW38_000587 [Coemansia aciculifera]|uniref:Uncharacterized protein n=1 Tax=Coemansia aciculifera TaxID=417176 RepID=A0ACC1M8P6_9FUNG|nr:hypothetical protein IWW38_000587 [Coemansia aciculifera]